MATDALIDQVLAALDEPDAGPVGAVIEGLASDSVVTAATVPLSITEAAELVGLSAHTLRYYEAQGLIQPARNASGYREYSLGDLKRLVFLTRMRLSGMTMTDLKHYIALVEQGAGTRSARRQIMLAQRARIRRQMDVLRLALETTEHKIRSYGGHPEE